MPKYRYRARDYDGNPIESEIEALDRKDLESKLEAMGYILISADSNNMLLNQDIFSSFKKVSSKDLVQFSVQLATLINSGISLLNSIEILESQVKSGPFKKSIGRIRVSLNQGKSFSEALAEQPEVFSGLYVGLVKSGEASGHLDEVLSNLANYMEVSESNKSKVRSALVYPAFMAGFAVLTVVFLISYVLPKFIEIFDSYGAQLPLLTRILLNSAEFFKEKWYICIVLIVAMAAGINAFIATKFGNYHFDKFKLRMPIFGILIKKSTISRFCRTFGILMRSSVSIIYALDILKESVGNEVISEVIDSIKETVTHGGSVHEEIEKSEVFPLMVSRMISVGESTGALDKMLFKISDFYDADVESEIKAVTSVIEPILIMVLGLVIGVIVISIMTPMFDMIKVMRG